MLTATSLRNHKNETGTNQMLFSFAKHDPGKTTLVAKRAGKRAQQKRAPSAPSLKEEAAATVKEKTLSDLILLLHQLAQKYVSRTNFKDFDSLIQCTKLMQNMEFSFTLPPDMQSPVADYTPAVVVNAPQYRFLRSRAMAALATLADLSHKAPSKGSQDFQRGMRAGFTHASEIAVFFLEDLESSFDFRRPVESV